jgi:hypothetical protein
LRSSSRKAILGRRLPAAQARIDGLQWIAEAMKADTDVGKWFRDRTSNVFMEFLDVLVSEMRPSCHGITRLARRCSIWSAMQFLAS